MEEVKTAREQMYQWVLDYLYWNVTTLEQEQREGMAEMIARKAYYLHLFLTEADARKARQGVK